MARRMLLTQRLVSNKLISYIRGKLFGISVSLVR